LDEREKIKKNFDHFSLSNSHIFFFLVIIYRLKDSFSIFFHFSVMLQNRSFSGSHLKNVARQKESQREVSL